ncbi:MAG TPA: NUDIX domain-containing protein [Chloroflexia bacterium]|nr:NUDIX domain-containing protein [Chloroflexia bacterium]
MSDIQDHTPEKAWKTYNVVQGVVIFGQKVLLVGNDYGGPELTWSLPGGRIEPGEQLLTAVEREVREETGLEVVAKEFLYVMDARSSHDLRHFITCVFKLDLLHSGESEPEVSQGTDMAVKAVRWVPFEEVVKLIQSPSLGEGLVNYLYYGLEKMPSRYWSYPEYLAPDWQPLTWPPRS